MLTRAFSVVDVPKLTELLHRAYAELGSAGLNFTAVDQDDATTLRRASGGNTWVIEDDGALIAAMTISWPAEAQLQRLTPVAGAPGMAWLNQLAVHPERRGEGLASTLRDIGYAWCLNQGATHIGLDTALPAEHLVRMYTAWGFAQADTVQWPGKSYRSVVMTRELLEGDAASLLRAEDDDDRG